MTTALEWFADESQSHDSSHRAPCGARASIPPSMRSPLSHECASC